MSFKILTPFLPKKLFGSIKEKVIVTGIGKEAIEQAVNNIYHSGTKTAIFVGSCGGIYDTKIGDIVLPLFATCSIGINAFNKIIPNVKITNIVKREALTLGIPLKHGSVISVISTDEESGSFASLMESKEIKYVDMELYFFIKKCHELGIESAALLYVTDILNLKPFTESKTKEEKSAIILARKGVISVVSNIDFKIDNLLEKVFGFELGINKRDEIERLIYEISRREKISFEDVIISIKLNEILNVKDMSHLVKFSLAKQVLLKRRFPLTFDKSDFSPYLSKVKGPSINRRIYNTKFIPERIFIEEGSIDTNLAKRVISMFPEVVTKTIANIKEYRKEYPAAKEDPKKRDLIITKQEWDFVKPCPCTKEAVYCGYNVINLGFGCPFDCTYCYLQHYANSGGIMVDSNVEDFLPKIDEYLKSRSGSIVRIGTGEFTDSLALDHITEYSKTLVPFFANTNGLFELKTKSVNIDNLLQLNHNGQTVISWSLNPEKIVSAEENGAAPLLDRLLAAKKCASIGYKIAFHFDPIFHYDGWEADYKNVINLLFDHVNSPEWISIGTVRFHRSLKGCIESRFPDTEFIYGEMVLGIDKKVRYHSSIRKDISEKMVKWIRDRNRTTYAYLCMETKEIWRTAVDKK